MVCETGEYGKKNECYATTGKHFLQSDSSYSDLKTHAGVLNLQVDPSEFPNIDRMINSSLQMHKDATKQKH